ncbi:MAG: protein kinase domain-containing protein [Myxococcaceae bacterium]
MLPLLKAATIPRAVQDLQLIEKFADGASADLFFAQWRSSGERCVVELVRTEVAQSPQALERFQAETEFRRSLVHPHLARRISLGSIPGGSPYVVSEALSGPTLRECLLAGPMSTIDVVRLAKPLCDALMYLHEAGFTHGNVCPEQVVMVGGLKAFQPKLLDSGLALLRTGVRRDRPTKPFVRAEYLSPERAQGQRARMPSDIYGLGVLLFECLTGMPPFTDEDASEVRRLHIEGNLPPLPESAQLMGPILTRCLAKNVDQRFLNAAELRESFSRPKGTPPRTPRPAAGAMAGALSRVTPPSPVPPFEATPSSPSPLKVSDQMPSVDVIGAYQLLRPLGKGGMGRVFAARHTRLGRNVAIKLLHPELAGNAAFVERMVREAQAANRIAHEHIVQIHDFVEELGAAGGPRYCCVMELLEGEALSAAVRREPIAIRRAAHVLRQVCDALHAAHQVGVVHRDVKPDNIFLTERFGQQDFVKLLDFGVAKVANSGQPGMNVTTHGEIIGTPAYMAPEQIRGTEPDARTDVYSVGTVLYRLLSGQLPFRSKNFAEHCVMVLQNAPPPLPSHTPRGERIPEELAELVMRAMEKDPSRRPQDAAELSVALSHYEKEEVFTLAPKPVVPTPVVVAQRDTEAVARAVMPEVGPLAQDLGRLDFATPPRTSSRYSNPSPRPPEPEPSRSVRNEVPGWAMLTIAVALLIFAAGLWRVRVAPIADTEDEVKASTEGRVP